MTTFQAIVVEHDTGWPGLDAMVAAELTGRILSLLHEPGRLRCVRLRPERDSSDEATWEYVAPYGGLVANGFFWIERATHRIMEPWADEALGCDRDGGVPEIISLNSRRFRSPLTPAISEAMRRRTAGALALRVREADGGQAYLLVEKDDVGGAPLARISCDAYGRPRSELASGTLAYFLDYLGIPATAGEETQPPRVSRGEPPTRSPRILVIGEESHLRSVYPPVLAAIGDAADHLGLRPAVEFLSAHEVEAVEGRRRIGEAQGLLLPGGGDMTQTGGQIAAAARALDASLPTLGLCLGMQTMVVAVARHRAGLVGGDLEEVNPEASYHIFRRLRDLQGEPFHRLGSRESAVHRGTRLGAILRGDHLSERMNHRYYLNPDWLPRLEAAGLRVAATSADGRIADAIDYPEHPFFMGLQGHPEMSSRAGQPHPVIEAFLAHVAQGGARR